MYEAGTHAGFPHSKVLLWTATKQDFALAASKPPEELVTFNVAKNVELDEALQGFQALQEGTVVACCLPDDVAVSRPSASYSTISTQC